MPIFIADVHNVKKQRSQVTIQAKNEAAVVRELRKRNLRPIRIQEQLTLAVEKPAQMTFLLQLESLMNPVTVKDLAIFTRQLAAMIGAGVALMRSIETLAIETENPRLKKVLIHLCKQLRDGVNLSTAMGKHPDCFDRLYVSMIASGEVGGVLDEVLERLSKVLEDSSRLKNQVKSALAYPVAVGILSVIVFLAMTIFLIPIFADIFKGLGTELPELTLFMLGVSAILTSWKAIIPIAIIAGMNFGYRWYYGTRAGRMAIDGIFLSMPLLGTLNRRSATAKFCRVYGSLTSSGVSILTTLDILEEAASNACIVSAIKNAKAKVGMGVQLSEALKPEGVFPGLSLQMMRVGEETGGVDKMMTKVADFYEDEVEQSIKALTSLIEPIMMVFLAGMVAVILLSMYLPMFKVFDKIG
jgi:type IV pilus assembly protein PilC